MGLRVAPWVVIFLGILTAGMLTRSAPITASLPHSLTTGCNERVQNGGFESGAAGWEELSAQGYELISDFNPRSGTLGAYLGGVNNADDSLGQALTLPAGNTLTLTCWWYLATAETAGAFDILAVELLRADGAPLATLASFDNTAPAGQWERLSFDLSAYAGQNATLRFAARTDDSNVSDFYLDDISLVACPSETTATPGSTPTAPAVYRLYLPLIRR